MTTHQSVIPRRAADLTEVDTLAPETVEERDTPQPSVLLQGFDTIHLPEMTDVALLQRVDTKYLLSEGQLCQALVRLSYDYQVLELGGRRQHRYRTLYFDTPDMALYRQHHSGKRNRYKVRERAYADTHQAFLEVKHKVNTNTTVKNRRETQDLSLRIPPDALPFLRMHYPYPVKALEPKLLNTFQRITLVSTDRAERLTIDLGLLSFWNGAAVSLNGIAIAEVKQDRFSPTSEFIRQMRVLGVRATGFSKYCIGVALLHPEIKHNRFTPQLRRIARLLQKEKKDACPTRNSR